MATSFFAVTRVPGPAWENLPMRSQKGWDAHARFMDDLAARGFIVLGGPLTDSEQVEVLLVIAAEDEAQLWATLQQDPWEPTGILKTIRIRPWTILLDSRI